MLESWGFNTTTSIDQWLTSWDLSTFDVIVFDPEYRLYGVEAHTGIEWLDWRYGGLSPTESDYLKSHLAGGQLGLVYMEPYPVIREENGQMID